MGEFTVNGVSVRVTVRVDESDHRVRRSFGDAFVIEGEDFFVYVSCMATKTISLELDAYEKLKRAKRGPRESFSSVVRRARWDDSTTAGELVDVLRKIQRLHPESFLDDLALDRIDQSAASRDRRPRATTDNQ